MPGRYYSNSELINLLNEANHDDRKLIAHLIDPDLSRGCGASQLQDEICKLGGHGVSNFFRGKGTGYLDILDDVAKKLEIPDLPPYYPTTDGNVPAISTFDNYQNDEYTSEESIELGLNYAHDIEGRVIREFINTFFERLVPEEKLKFIQLIFNLAKERNEHDVIDLTPEGVLVSLEKLNIGVREDIEYYLAYTFVAASETEGVSIQPGVVPSLTLASMVVFPVLAPGILASYAYGNYKPDMRKLIPIVVLIGLLRRQQRSQKLLAEVDIQIKAIENVRKCLASVTEEIAKSSGEKISRDTKNWLERTRSGNPGKHFEEHLERNTVFFYEYSSKLLSSLITFIMTDYELDAEFIKKHLQNGRQLSVDTSHLVYKYLGLDEGENLPPVGAEIYEFIKQIKESSSQSEEYKVSLGRFCCEYRARCQITKIFINILQDDIERYSALHEMDENDLQSAINTQVSQLYIQLFESDEEQIIANA